MSYITTKLNFLASYSKVLCKYPLATNMLTSGLLAGAGDVICQKIFENHPQGLNPARTGRMMTLSVLFTPVTRVWYSFLPKLAERFVSRQFLRPFAIAIFNQIFYAPVLVTSWFFLAKYMETWDVRESIDSMKGRWLQALKVGWAVWPFASLIAFSIVPDMYRILFMSCVSFGWNIYRSWLQHNPVASEKMENLEV